MMHHNRSSRSTQLQGAAFELPALLEPPTNQDLVWHLNPDSKSEKLYFLINLLIPEILIVALLKTRWNREMR